MRELSVKEQDIPSSAEEGWLRGQKNIAELPYSRADGVVLVRKSYSLTNTTPAAPSKDASQHFLDVASTPPQLRRGSPTALQVIHVFRNNPTVPHRKAIS
jgi:hypothetical protein